MADLGWNRVYRCGLFPVVMGVCSLAQAEGQDQMWGLVEDAVGTTETMAGPLVLFDMWLLGLILGVLAVGGFLWYVYRMRMNSLYAAEAFSDAAFEAEVMRSLGTMSPESFRPPDFRSAEEPLGQRSEQRTDIPLLKSQESSTTDNDRVDVRCGWVVEALRQAGIVADLESLEMRHGLPKAAAELSLVGGGRALLLQDTEPLPALVHLLARYDLLVIAGGQGKAVVVKTVQQTIADRF